MKFCIKIKTFDERYLYVGPDDLKTIFVFKGIIFDSLRKVKFNDQKIININDLSIALSDHTFSHNRSKINDHLSEDIKNYILNSFEKKNILNFNGLKERFKDYDVTTSNLYNYLNNIKKIYKKKGREIKRVKSGIFKLF